LGVPAPLHLSKNENEKKPCPSWAIDGACRPRPAFLVINGTSPRKKQKKATTTTMMMLFRLVAGLGQDLVGIEESSWCGHTHIAIAI